MIILTKHCRHICHLWRLPRELRDIIWQYALGGLAFHIKAKPPAESREYYILSTPLTGKATSFDWLYLFNTSRPYRTSLLRTCKKIYAETRLIPYVHNVLAFSNGWELNDFVKYTLTPEQSSAITMIHFKTWTGEREVEVVCEQFRPVLPAALAALTRLKSIYLLLSYWERINDQSRQKIATMFERGLENVGFVLDGPTVFDGDCTALIFAVRNLARRDDEDWFRQRRENLGHVESSPASTT